MSPLARPLSSRERSHPWVRISSLSSPLPISEISDRRRSDRLLQGCGRSGPCSGADLQRSRIHRPITGFFPKVWSSFSASEHCRNEGHLSGNIANYLDVSADKFSCLRHHQFPLHRTHPRRQGRCRLPRQCISRALLRALPQIC